MNLAMLRRTSGWIVMLCMTIALGLAGESAVQAFEMAEHAGLHAAESTQDIAQNADDGADTVGDSRKAADLAGEDHHHPADHHSVGLLTDMSAGELALLLSQRLAPASGLRRDGLAGFGIERPPKA